MFVKMICRGGGGDDELEDLIRQEDADIMSVYSKWGEEGTDEVGDSSLTLSVAWIGRRAVAIPSRLCVTLVDLFHHALPRALTCQSWRMRTRTTEAQAAG